MESSKPSSVTTTQIIEHLWDLYCENPKRFHIARNGTVYMPKDKGTPRTLQRRHLAGHLAGYYALCLFGQEKASRFLCLDVDHGGWELAQKAISTLKDIGFDRNKIYASTSGNKGYHIEMFFTSPIEYTWMKRLYQELLRRMEITSRDVELRPSEKQSIKIPLGKHQSTGRICWYIDTETGEEIHEQQYVLGIQKIEAVKAQTLMKKCSIASLIAKEIPEDVKTRTQIDIVEFPNIVQSGTRHDTILNIAGAIEARGYSVHECKRILRAWYAFQDLSCIRTKEQRAIHDMEKIIDWIYRKGHRTHTKAVVFPADIKRIVTIRSMVGRAIYFHVLVWERVMNADRITQKRLASIFGVAVYSVEKAMAGLRKQSYINMIAGQHHWDQYGFYTDKSSLTIAGDTVLDPLSAKTAIVEPQQMQKNFWKIYFETLFALADEDWVKSNLCKRERDKLEEVRRHEN